MNYFFSLIALVVLLFAYNNYNANTKTNTNYYFHSTNGISTNNGTSPKSAFSSFEALQTLNLEAGDTLFLAAGETFSEPLQLKNITGKKDKPIVITTYPKDAKQKAFINTKGDLNAVLIENSSYIEIHNLDISAQSDQKNTSNEGTMRCGVLVTATETGVYEHIYLSNLTIHDVFFENENFIRPKNEVKTANGTQAYGWGIRFINNTNGARISDVKIQNSSIYNVSHTGIKLTSRLDKGAYGIQDFSIENNIINKTGGPGIQMSGAQKGHIFNNLVDQSGSADDSRKWGRGSGLWTWGSNEVLIEHNKFTNANGPGDSAGAHIDFNCKNIVLQYNFSANNAGGFCEILGNNYNCAYRYNISINDGHRVKGENGAFQEGKTLWLSGYAGNEQIGPFNSYFYNNTIYVGKHIIPKIAIHRKANGILIANNIFHFENDAEIVKGDQYNPASDGKWEVKNVLFSNNLFLKQSTWPEDYLLQDESPMYGDANFMYQNATELNHFTPKNIAKVKNKGVQIPLIAGDSLGLLQGLQLEKDILGNTVQGVPDLGAIEIVGDD